MANRNEGLFNETSDRKRIIVGFTQSLKKRFSIGMAYALYCLWMLLCLSGPAIEIPHSPSFLPSIPAWVLPLFFMAVSSLFLAIHFKLTRRVFSNPKRFIILAVTMVAAALLHGVWLLSPHETSVSNTVLYMLASMIAGITTAFFRIEIDRVFGWLGTQQTLSQVMSGTLVTGVLFLAITHLPPWTPMALAPLAAIACSALLAFTTRNYPQVKFYSHGVDVELHFPMKFVITSFVQGCFVGVFFFWLFEYSPHTVGTGLNFASDLIAVAILFGLLLLLRMNFNRLIYKVAFPVIALGFILLAFVSTTENVSFVVLIAGLSFLDLVLWSLGACLIKNMGLPAPWIACCPGAALFFGNIVGCLIVVSLATSDLLDDQGLYILGTIVACGILACALFLSSNSNLKYGWGTVQPGDSGFPFNGIQFAVQFMAADYNLTNRETEVFLLIAQGKNRTAICDHLCVSLDTVKTHTQNIYRKLSVHSQQELIERVNNELEHLSPLQPEEDELA